jgi:hypothetical protein
MEVHDVVINQPHRAHDRIPRRIVSGGSELTLSIVYGSVEGIERCLDHGEEVNAALTNQGRYGPRGSAEVLDRAARGGR